MFKTFDVFTQSTGRTFCTVPGRWTAIAVCMVLFWMPLDYVPEGEDYF